MKKSGPKATKRTIVRLLAYDAGIPARTAHAVLTALLAAMRRHMEKDVVLEVDGFGTFEMRLKRGRRVAPDLLTGEPRVTRVGSAVKFTPSWHVTERLAALAKEEHRHSKRFPPEETAPSPGGAAPR